MRYHLIEFKALFFRDQFITPEDHVSFGKKFGSLETYPFTGSHHEHPEVMTIKRSPEENLRHGQNPDGKDCWHADVSWRATPSFGSILRAVSVSPVGGDTLWSDMVAPSEGLSTSMKNALVRLRAVHTAEKAFGSRLPPMKKADLLTQFPACRAPDLAHTARYWRKDTVRLRILHVPHSRHGSTRQRRIAKILYRQAAKPEYQARLSWRPGTVPFWDNRSRNSTHATTSEISNEKYST
ncbi:TauD/TfdA family dioxygenase [Rhodococcus sp. BH4]|uniref:TauD/TfdA dioxygenase family protein n=1 Tax=Rhodococcus sp. BH4 TaxID=1807790 RepID=UPI0009D926B3